MRFTETDIDGAFVLDLEPHEDERGFFARAFDLDAFARHGLVTEYVQANIGFSARRGVLRGLHYQVAPHAEAKLVRCTRGAIFDVVVDLRPESGTYRRWHGEELSADNRRAVYLPAGCAHGYLALADSSEVFYQASTAYMPSAERGVRWDDPAFGIRWPLAGAPSVSEKDASWPDYAG